MKKNILFLFVLFGVCVYANAIDRPIHILVPNSTAAVPFLELASRDDSDDILPGVTIQVEIFVNHAQALARLLNGDIELLYTGSSVGWENSNNGGPVVMIGTGVWGISSIVGPDIQYKSLQDLKNKTVALPFPGSPLDLQMRYIFEKNGIDPEKDLRIVYTPFPQAAGQILIGKMDAAPLPEPLATVMVVEQGLSRYVEVKDAWAAVNDGDALSPQLALFATADTLAVIADILPDLVAAWNDTSNYVTDFPEQAAEKYAEALGFDRKIISTAIEHTIFRVITGEENRQRVLEYFSLLYNEPGAKTPDDDFFVTF